MFITLLVNKVTSLVIIESKSLTGSKWSTDTPNELDANQSTFVRCSHGSKDALQK